MSILIIILTKCCQVGVFRIRNPMINRLFLFRFSFTVFENEEDGNDINISVQVEKLHITIIRKIIKI
jgi:hypothetical protein